MKLSCNIIRDLWLLYENDDCSEDSRMAVEQHLAECEECGKLLKIGTLPETLLVPETIMATDKTANALKNSVKKIRKRWLASLLAVLSIIPLIGCGIMGVHQYQGEGICFSNIDEILVVRQFLTDIQNGNMEEAVEKVSYKSDYESIVQSLTNSEPDVIKVKLHHETYIAKQDFVEQWLQTTTLDEEESLDMWEYWVNNMIIGFIPEEIWNGIPIEREVADVYEPLETKWGVFFVEKNMLQNNVNLDAETLYGIFPLIPEEIYEEAKPFLLEEIENNKQWIYNEYGDVLNMSEEEYTKQSQHKLAEMFVESNIEIVDFKYDGSYKTEDAWHIEYRTKEVDKNGQAIIVIFDFVVTDHKLELAASKSKNRRMSPLEKILMEGL